jgi:hypothetical protein
MSEKMEDDDQSFMAAAMERFVGLTTDNIDTTYRCG